MTLRALLPAVALSALALAGCGGPTMAPVTGRVTFNGRPVPDAAVTFAPDQKGELDKEPGKPATGFTDAAGAYRLSTHRSHDGALVGRHTVTVELDETNPVKCARHKKVTFEVKPGDNQFDIEMDPK